ncbi:MAG: hypothetical protein O2887_15700 [Bacteroidetes bacterium]|nr:hypothetical protein [Bacteroidota bacterium]MDA1121907.1 hypothetical protein [Bacteroidota bacterium]
MNKIQSSTFLVFLLITSFFIASPSIAQEADEVEINYLWIDTVVKIDGKDLRIVSDAVVTITCCMKSPLYSRTSRKAVKWIRQNYDDNYDGMAPFKSIQDKDLATTIVNEAIALSEKDKSIRLVSYTFQCD